jgi:hypothetical protein
MSGREKKILGSGEKLKRSKTQEGAHGQGGHGEKREGSEYTG